MTEAERRLLCEIGKALGRICGCAGTRIFNRYVEDATQSSGLTRIEEPCPHCAGLWSAIEGIGG